MSLRQLRQDRHLTQAELARRAKVGRRTICNIEAGSHQCRMSIRRKLLRALHLPFAAHHDVFGALPDVGKAGRPRR